MAWISDTTWSPSHLPHEVIVEREKGSNIISSVIVPSLIVNGEITAWKRVTTIQNDVIVKSEFRGLTLASAQALINVTGMDAITFAGGRVTHKSSAALSRANDANGYTVTRTVVDSTYQSVEGPI